MSQTNQSNLYTPFLSAFAGMVVAIPVAVTISVMVVKANLSQEETQLNGSIAKLTAANYAPVTTTQTGSDAQATTCNGTASAVSAPKTSWTGTHSAWYPTTTNNSYNTTNTSTVTYTDSFNTKTVDIHNKIVTINSNNHGDTDINSDNTTVNHNVDIDVTTNSNNNSGNTTVHSNNQDESNNTQVGDGNDL